MKYRMFNVAALALTMFSALLPSISTGQARSLELNIQLSKTRYLVNEPVFLDVRLINASADTARTVWMYPAFPIIHWI